MGLTRRNFLETVSLGSALALAPRYVWAQGAQSPLSYLDIAGADWRLIETRFERWLVDKGLCKSAGARNMVYNFYLPQEDRGEWIYPMLTGKAMLWLLQRGRQHEAEVLSRALLRWQQTSQEGPLARCFGAFPSKLEPTADGFTAGERYYSGDNLVILAALIALYRHNHDAKLLNSAIGVGTWLSSIMSQGQRFGIWAEDHGAPVWFVTRAGDFANQIPCHMETLWIDALRQLGLESKEAAYTRQVERAEAFYRLGQRADGAFWDHYDPGYPPTAYNGANWKGFQPGQFVADNALRTALGACRRGDLLQARKFFAWLNVDKGAISAYLNDQGRSGFPSDDEIYYDLASTGMHRSLCQWLGERSKAEEDMAFLRQTQAANGAWYWGYRRQTLKPRTLEQAPVSCLWATADLSVPLSQF